MMERQVYFVLRSDGAIKIGWSYNPKRRCMALKYQLKTPIHLIASFYGQPRHERALHRRFSHLRIEGEWFVPNQALFAVIAGVLTGEDPVFTWHELADAHKLKAAA